MVISASVLAAVLSLATSLAGLPEVKMEETKTEEDKKVEKGVNNTDSTPKEK